MTFDVQAYSNLWFYANPVFIRPAGTPKLLVEKNAELVEKLDHHRFFDHTVAKADR